MNIKFYLSFCSEFFILFPHFGGVYKTTSSPMFLSSLGDVPAEDPLYSFMYSPHAKPYP